MFDQDISSEYLANLIDDLVGKLVESKVLNQSEFMRTNNPISDLQYLHTIFLEHLAEVRYQHSSTSNNEQLQTLKAIERENSNNIMSSLRNFVQINEELFKLSDSLFYRQYEQLTILRTFRRLYELINDASTALFQCVPSDIETDKERKQLLGASIEISNKIYLSSLKNKDQITPIKRIQPDVLLDKTYSHLIKTNKLKSQENRLYNWKVSQNKMIKNSPSKYKQQKSQTQRYNHTILDLQHTIRQYEVRFDKIREYESVITTLQHKIIRMKEQKYRDEMLIENMARKIKGFEKERLQGDSIISFSKKRQFLKGSRTPTYLGKGNSMSTYDLRNQSTLLDGRPTY